MNEIQWDSDNEVFKVAGSVAYEVVFDDINDDLQVNNSVVDVVAGLLRTKTWVDEGRTKTLDTNFALQAWRDANGEIYLVVSEYEIDDGYVFHEDFGYLDILTTAAVETLLIRELLGDLAAFIRLVSAPVVFNTRIRLRKKQNDSSLIIESLRVFLPHQVQRPRLLSQTCPKNLGSEITSNLYTSGRASIAICTLRDASPYRLAMYERERVRQHISENVDEDTIVLEMNLIPEPDNDYDPQAIAIAIPQQHGNSLDERKIGYLYKHERGPLLGGLINDLVQYLDEDISCYAVIDRSPLGEHDLHILLPHLKLFENELQTLLDSELLEFLKREKGAISASRGDSLREQVIRAITRFDNDASSSSISLSTGDPDPMGVRMVVLLDSETNRTIGSVYQGLLLVDDERLRAKFASKVKAAGIKFADPVPEYLTFVHGMERLPNELIPNIGVRVYARYIAFETNSKVDSGHRQLLAEYNRSTRILWVQDEAIVPYLCRYASRLGIEISRVKSPVTPWWLEEQVHFADRRDYSGKYADIAEHYKYREIRGLPLKDSESVSERALRDKYILARERLFPDHSILEDRMPCRVCGQDSLAFNVVFSNQSLAYCQECLEGAYTGGHEPDKAVVLEIVMQLSELEFFGEAPLVAQLKQINSLGHRGISPHDIDRMLSLRSRFKPSEWSWFELLAESGLIKDGVRTARGTKILARDGHLCNSLYEKAVDDFFHWHNISHEIEPLYPFDPELNPEKRRRGDWRLSDGTFVEMWGLLGDPLYEMKRTEKIALAKRQNLTLIGLKPKDITNLPKIFEKRIK